MMPLRNILVRAGERVVIHTPEWPNIANAVRLREARAFVLSSPNNPTGWTATADELQSLLDICRRKRIWLIADEAYSRLVYTGAAAAASLLEITDPDDRVMACNSFSKTWIMTGWRIGWIVVLEGARNTVMELVTVTHSGVAPFIKHGGIAAIGDPQVAEDFRAVCAEERRITDKALVGLILRPCHAERGVLCLYRGECIVKLSNFIQPTGE